MHVAIRPLDLTDRVAWEPLWQAYQRFYQVEIPQGTTDATWARFHDPAEPVHAFSAFDADGRMVGIVHAILHRSTWLPDWSCYLQDLYVDESQRGQRTGEALIDAVADFARENKAGRLYWLTQESNITARRLYDRIAQASGFVQYRKQL